MDTFEIVLPSALFPFSLADLPRFTYGGYELENVFRAITPAQQQACVEVWLRHGVIVAPKTAWDRSAEVCYLMKEAASGQLVGLNTLYPDRLTPDGPRWFFNRMFIEPASRNSRLMIVATAATVCYAKARLASEGLPGVMNVNENPKLARPGMRRIFSRLGYEWQARHIEQDVWCFDFSRVAIRENS